MNIFLIILAALIVAIVLLFIYTRSKLKSFTNVGTSEKILTLTNENFTHQLKGKTMLVDFWADWCMPCKMMAPILNDLAADLSENHFVAKLDVDKNQSTAQKYNVRSIPTLILFENGKEINRFVGVKTKDFLKKEMMKSIQ
ncbi:MAG: thioredoxin [Paludibacteraceae bacterium]